MLAKREQTMPAIHLAPRVIVNSAALGRDLTVEDDGPGSSDALVDIEYLADKRPHHLLIREGGEHRLEAVTYWLDLRDGMGVSRKRMAENPLLRVILKRFGRQIDLTPTYETTLTFKQTTLTAQERAVLERLSMGALQILGDSLIGSPEVISSLINKGQLVLLPNFHHVGIYNEYYARGTEVWPHLRDLVIEASVFSTAECQHAVIAAQPRWNGTLFRTAIDLGIEVSPIITSTSHGGLLRYENVFPNDVEMWQ